MYTKSHFLLSWNCRRKILCKQCGKGSFLRTTNLSPAIHIISGIYWSWTLEVSESSGIHLNHVLLTRHQQWRWIYSKFYPGCSHKPYRQRWLWLHLYTYVLVRHSFYIQKGKLGNKKHRFSTTSIRCAVS